MTHALSGVVMVSDPCLLIQLVLRILEILKNGQIGINAALKCGQSPRLISWIAVKPTGDKRKQYVKRTK
jgi:hypothetical protein